MSIEEPKAKHRAGTLTIVDDDQPREVTAARCCAPAEQRTCCEPGDKAACCGAAPAGSCGCR